MQPLVPSISSDLAPVDPSHDIFGFSTFADKVASSILTMSSPQGLVLAVNGPWGSGKTTLLNFVKHTLQGQPANSGPVIIDFNPWWFAGKEDLAPQIIEAFRRSLPTNLVGKATKLKDSLSEYSDLISISASLAGGSAWAQPILGGLLKSLKKKEKLLPALKKEIAEALLDQSRKFVFIVDDIDRLSPPEVCDLLRVIKALGDFPNVIYLLSFDAPVVTKSIASHLNVDGAEYLEKIVQASFAIPAVDRLKLRKWFFEKLDAVTSAYGQSEFDPGYWASVYFGSLDKLIQTPRDVVRITNSLAVTYPAVAGEVNIVDFVAIEILRIFNPAAYEVVRENKDMFVGKASTDASANAGVTAFHNRWMEQANLNQAGKALLAGIFPKVEAAVTGNALWSTGPSNWRRSLRIAHPDAFDIYFQFGVPEGAASRHFLAMLTNEAKSGGSGASRLLMEAADVQSLSGGSLLEDVLERISDSDEEMSEDSARGLLMALFHVGERVFKREKLADQVPFFGVPPRIRIRWAITSLIGRMQADARMNVIAELIEQSVSPSVIVDCLDSISAAVEGGDPSEKEIAAFGHLVDDELALLRDTALARLKELDGEIIADMLDADFVLNRILKWFGLGAARRILLPLIFDPRLCPRLIEGFLRFSRSQTAGDPAIHKTPGLITRDLFVTVDPMWLRVSLEGLMAQGVTENQSIAMNLIIKDQQKGAE